MSVSTDFFANFISKLEGFDQLPSQVVANLLEDSHPTRYRVGQKILGKDIIPDGITIIYEGRVRLLAHDPRTQVPTTLRFLESGDVLGEVSVLRSLGCETAIASSEVTCLTLDSSKYLDLLSRYPAFAEVRKSRCHLLEIFEILGVQKEITANAGVNLKELAQNAFSRATVDYLQLGKNLLSQLDSRRVWFVSSATIKNLSPGSPIELLNGEQQFEVRGKHPTRLIGLYPSDLLIPNNNYQPHQIQDHHSSRLDEIEIPYASSEESSKNFTTVDNNRKIKYPFFHGKGQLDSAIACFQMVSKHLQMPFRREIVNRVLNDNNKRQGSISFQLCAYLAELIGLKAQLIDVSLTLNSITRIPTPALIRYEDNFVVLYEANEKVIVLGIPSEGIQRFKPKQILAQLEAQLEVEETNSQPRIRI